MSRSLSGRVAESQTVSAMPATSQAIAIQFAYLMGYVGTNS